MALFVFTYAIILRLLLVEFSKTSLSLKRIPKFMNSKTIFLFLGLECQMRLDAIN